MSDIELHGKIQSDLDVLNAFLVNRGVSYFFFENGGKALKSIFGNELNTELSVLLRRHEGTAVVEVLHTAGAISVYLEGLISGFNLSMIEETIEQGLLS